MSSLNPSHLLISRNPPRSPAHPQLAPTLSSRHSPSASLPPNLNSWTGAAGSNTGDLPTRSATASGFRSSTTLGTLDTNDNTAYREDEQIQIHPTFRADAPLPGRVKIIIGRNEFWCHKEVLWFASPFFQGLLEGNWAETNPGRPPLVTVIPGAASRRDSWTTSSPTDTDVAALPGVPELSEDKSHADNDDADDTALDITDEDVDEEGHSSSSGGKKESIYLDAAEDGPSMAQILRELRDLPEVPTAAPQPYDNDLFEERDTSSAVLDPASIVINETTQGQTIQGALDLPSFWPTTQSTLPPTLADRLSEPHRERSSSAHTRSRRRSALRHSFSSSVRVSTRSIQRDLAAPGYQTVDAVVELHEESALAFQDFLFWAYPHLECKVLWSNVENLLALSLKLLTPALQKLCEQFLLTYASGRPVLALMLAEQYGNAELFKEASRFVLDQTTWCSEEMDCLDESTQLKLSQRRNWFLERLLKLGTIDVKREYTCRSDCPDPGKCQVQLEEKWRQAYATVCRYGPPQPSIAFRCLRQLDPFPTGPTLLASHPYCQRAAKSWATTLFDRMFETKTVLSPSNPGTEKYWLTISLV